MLVWLLLVVTRPSLWAAETSPTIQLSTDTLVASEGYFVLSWTSPASVTDLSLQLQATQGTGSPRIRDQQLPANGAITITGLADGEYTYRLLGDDQFASNSVTVTVQHHALSRALTFFLLGFILFSILVGTIIVGRSRDIAQQQGEDSVRNSHA